MFRRQPGKPDAIDASVHSRRSAVADSAWSAQDRLRSGSREALRAGTEGAGSAFERISYFARKRLIWPLEDRAEALGAPARSVSFGLVVLLAAAVGVGGLVWAAPDRPDRTASAPAAETAAPLAAVAPAPDKQPQPTLHGAAPVFKPTAAARQGSEVDPAKAAIGTATDPADSSTPAPATKSSPATEPLAAGASTSAAPRAKVDGPPAGPQALAVAHDFADAFVLYETGGTDAGVRTAFGATATPALSKALLERPPRLPAKVDVPKAKVLNIVAAPSHGSVFPVSISLLRVGVTSELRLEMEKPKGKRWRVTNVLG